MLGVVYQKDAFSIVDDGQINLTPDEEALRAARDALNGVDQMCIRDSKETMDER